MIWGELLGVFLSDSNSESFLSAGFERLADSSAISLSAIRRCREIDRFAFPFLT